MSIKEANFVISGMWFSAEQLSEMCMQKTYEMRSDANYLGYKDHLYEEIDGIDNVKDVIAYLKQYMSDAVDMGIRLQILLWKFQFMAAYDIAVEIEGKGVLSHGEVLQC